ncbi:MAG TPA: hypothetical protein EYP85_12995, partial [Armatimonadetes bacterium]|nr:hypothetical protein [Armatimonadota bacterium]
MFGGKHRLKHWPTLGRVAVVVLWSFSLAFAGSGKPTESQAATGLVYHEDYLKHQTRPGHPERPARLTTVLEHLRKRGLYQRLRLIPPRPAEIAWIAQVHDREYIRHVEGVCRQGGLLDSGDTPVGPGSYAVARLAVGGVLAAVDAVMAGQVRNAFCLVRPPG